GLTTVPRLGDTRCSPCGCAVLGLRGTGRLVAMIYAGLDPRLGTAGVDADFNGRIERRSDRAILPVGAAVRADREPVAPLVHLHVAPHRDAGLQVGKAAFSGRGIQERPAITGAEEGPHVPRVALHGVAGQVGDGTTRVGP